MRVIEDLRAAYFRDHGLPAKSVYEDINAVPLNHLNGALAATGEPWRARIVDGEYEFFVP